MRIEVVKAEAFGPFAGDALELAPGMNVIYGPNESGKTSWHAAIYAAMCGMKRTRGQPTREDRAFASRHRPWRGTTWRVSAVIALDDGRTIEVEQGLGSGGRSVARDLRTKRPVSDDIVRAGAVDVAALVGLTRETALATVFVRQADMLRVLHDASALQEFLERAAATNAADTTADQALARIDGYKKERVGLLRAGSRGPLATATARLAEARQTLDRAEERFESYQGLLARRQTAEADVRHAELRLSEVTVHERQREERRRWVEIHATSRRLEQARGLTADSRTNGTPAVDKEVLHAVSRAMVMFESRPPEPPELPGPTAAELQQELVALPNVPDGDLEPSREVTEVMGRWRAQRQRLASHDETEPVASAVPVSGSAPSELRRLADELDLPAPQVDPGLRDAVYRRRSWPVPPPRPLAGPVEPSAQARPAGGSRSSTAFVVAGFVAAVGAGLLVMGQLVLCAALLLLGAGIATAAAVVGRSRSSGHLQPGAPPSAPPAGAPPGIVPIDHDLPRLEARLALQLEAEAQAQHRRNSTLARLGSLSLPTNPDELRRLAAQTDADVTVQARHASWRARRVELEASESAASQALRAALLHRGMEADDRSHLDEALVSYTDECHARAALARQAERRADIDAQLRSRHAAETSIAQDLAARRAAEQELLVVAAATGCRASSVEDLPRLLRAWVSRQEEVDQARQQRDKMTVRLDQVLDGLTVGQLEAKINSLMEDAGEPPPVDAPALQDRSSELSALQDRVRQNRDCLAELVGQIEGAEQHLLDVNSAIEADARAAAELARLTVLAEDLDTARDILAAAQEKVHADIAPVLNDTIRPWVPRITRGRYDDIRVNPATLEVEAHERGGQFRSATVLSHGTTEQLFLLLRLALAQRLTTSTEKTPIILDDITVQSDADRTVAALDLLHELSAQHQVVLFSQEDEVLRWAEQHLAPPSDRLTRL